MTIIKLSDKQFDSIETETKRELMRQLLLLDTPKYRYALGALGQYWTLARFDMRESIGGREFSKDYEPEIIDRWI